MKKYFLIMLAVLCIGSVVADPASAKSRIRYSFTVTESVVTPVYPQYFVAAPRHYHPHHYYHCPHHVHYHHAPTYYYNPGYYYPAPNPGVIVHQQIYHWHH